jgi:catechol 2,3-dioxygenase-like lactoylglutathione lyase family enzyme
MKHSERPAGRAQINHAGLTVTDIDSAVAWYTEVFDLTLVFGPVEVIGSGRSRVIFGERFGRMKRAVLRDSSQAALEIFEFSEPATTRRQNNFDYWKTGFFHLCFTCEDVASRLAAVVAHGGRARTDPLDAGGGRVIAYCEDPFGNVLELTNKTLDETYGDS